VDKEERQAIIEGSTLWLTGEASVVVATCALEVDWMTQHLSPDLGKNPKTLRHHQFEHEGKTFRIPLHHLCLATCTTIILNYYGFKLKRAPIKVEDVAEAATRYYLEWLDAKGKKPPAHFPLTRDTSVTDIVRYKAESYPHNEMDFVLRGAQALIQKLDPKSTVLVDGGSANLMRTTWPNIKCLLGLGWPTILADDQSGNWDHARVCSGLVVDNKGKMVLAYVADPWNEDARSAKTDGSASDLGWAILGIPLPQEQISPKHLMSGGELPAPSRLAKP
jgi:hypothetical protein